MAVSALGTGDGQDARDREASRHIDGARGQVGYLKHRLHLCSLVLRASRCFLRIFEQVCFWKIGLSTCELVLCELTGSVYLEDRGYTLSVTHAVAQLCCIASGTMMFLVEELYGAFT